MYKEDDTIELAEHLAEEFGTERAEAIAWEMYNTAVLTRGELYLIKRILKTIDIT